MAPEITPNGLARLISLENIASLAVIFFLVGMGYMSLQSDIVTAQTTADGAEQHSLERAQKDEKQLKEIADDISTIQSNQAGFAEAMLSMKDGQLRIERQLEVLLDRRLNGT